jgi:hypothetical protein
MQLLRLRFSQSHYADAWTHTETAASLAFSGMVLAPFVDTSLVLAANLALYGSMYKHTETWLIKHNTYKFHLRPAGELLRASLSRASS